MALIKFLFKSMAPTLIVLTALTLAAPAYAAQASLLLGINEGTSGSDTYTEMQDKYKPLAHYLSVQLKRPVTVESARSLSSLDYNLKHKRYDLVLIRPSHIAAPSHARRWLPAGGCGQGRGHHLLHRAHRFAAQKTGRSEGQKNRASR